jgi:phospholipase C
VTRPSADGRSARRSPSCSLRAPFFATARYGNRTNRSFWVSAAPEPPGGETRPGGYGDGPTIFDRLEAAGVSWKFYVEDYNPAETFRAASPMDPASQTVRVPLLNYPRFVDRPELREHIVDLSQYYRDLVQGTLPAVAYISSSGSSEVPPARSQPARSWCSG